MLKRTLTYLLMLAAMLSTACRSGDEPATEGPPILTIYVYFPDSPFNTRADEGNVDASAAENRVNTLQLWVFESASGNKVAYHATNATDGLNNSATRQERYQVAVSNAFAEAKPNVDVFVLANAGSAALSLGENSTREQVADALMQKTDADDPFGLSTPATAVPALGLPMSGAARNLLVMGQNPVLRVSSNGTSMANIELLRMVSKMRFFFSRATGSTEVTIVRVALDANMIPDAEYAFNGNADNRVEGPYNTTAQTLFSGEELVKENDSPDSYAFQAGDAIADYEARLAEGLDGGKLSATPTYYLRESDKALSGKITYTVGTDPTERSVSFAMADAGDFSRNHTWTVYAYSGTDALEVNSVCVNGWNIADTKSHSVYNW